MYNYGASSIFDWFYCLNSLICFIIPLAFFGFCIWIVIKIVGGKKATKDKGDEYYSRVLKDLDSISFKHELDKSSFQKIYGFFKEKLTSHEKVDPIERKKDVVKTIAKEEFQIKPKQDARKKEGLIQTFRRTFITEFSAALLLYLGSFLIVSAALILTAFSWEQFSNNIKALILPVFLIAFAVSGLCFYNIKKIKSAGITFLIISEILIPLSCTAFWKFVLKDTQICSFWCFWLIVSAIFLILSVPYYSYLKSIITKVLLIFGVNSLIVSIALSLNSGVLETVLYMTLLNMAVLIASRIIKEAFLKKATFAISQTFNLFLYIYTVFYLLVLVVDQGTLSSKLITFVSIFAPILYCLVSYIQTRKWIFYFVFLLSILASFPYFCFLFDIRVEVVLLFFSIFAFVAAFLEEFFREYAKKVEKYISFAASLLSASLIVLWVWMLDITSNIDSVWVYVFIGIVVLYFLIRYFWNKSSIYLGLANFILIYPIINFVSSLDIQVNNSFGFIIFLVSVIYFIFSILLKQLKAKKSAYSVLPAFYFLNLFAILVLFINEAREDAIGLLFLANILMYLLISIYHYGGKATQLCVFWGLAAIPLISFEKLSGVQIAWAYILFGTLVYLLQEVIGKYKWKWENLEKNTISFLNDLKITNILFVTFTFAFAAIVALFSNSVGALLVILYLLGFFVFFAYRFNRTIMFILIFIFQILWIGKFNEVLTLSNNMNTLHILIIGCLNHLAAMRNTSLDLISEKFKRLTKAYSAIGIFFVLSVYLRAILKDIGLSSTEELIQSVFVLISISIILLHSLVKKNLGGLVSSIYLFLFLFWRIGIYQKVENAQYYLIPLGLSFHLTNLILASAKENLAKSNVFDIFGILTILSVSLLQSIDNGFYLLLLIVEGTVYALLWPYFGKKSLAVLSLIIVGIGMFIQIFNLILSFPQWLILGIIGLVVLGVGVIFLVVRKEK